jgi:diaminopimelate epimerase
MRFSKWHAHGNAYLLVERADLDAAIDPDLVRRACDPHRGVGSDGLLEVVSVEGPEAEIVVWNPDGSQAELSGNGARIAALWLARRSGVAFVRVRVGARRMPARISGDDVEIDLGAVEVGRPEPLEIDGERLGGQSARCDPPRCDASRPAAPRPSRGAARPVPGADEHAACARRRA